MILVGLLGIARQMKLLQLGTSALDGTKIHANASRHRALSYGHAQKIEAQLEAEVQELLARAEARVALNTDVVGLHVVELCGVDDVRKSLVRHMLAARSMTAFATDIPLRDLLGHDIVVHRVAAA